MKKAILFCLFVLVGVAQGAWAQNGVGSQPAKVDANDASITKLGHATVNARRTIVIDSLTQRVDTICTIDSVEWNTETGTAKRRQAASQQRRSAPYDPNNPDFYDKDYNMWWDIWWFIFNYPSVDAYGNTITLSALACMPDEDCKYVNNVVIGCHSRFE